MTTMRDVAKKAGVGVGTVSRALSDTGYTAKATREKIFAAADEMGYEYESPGRVPVKDITIGIMLPLLRHPFFSRISDAIETELHQRGFRCLLYDNCNNVLHQREAIDMLDEGIINGLIALGDPPPDFVKREGRAIISMDRRWGEDVPVVHSDHEQGGRLAAEAFLKSGCNKIIQFMGGNLSVSVNSRHTALEKILRRNGCQVTSVHTPWNFMGYSYDRSVVRDYWNVIREMDGCMTNDIAALSCLSIALEMGVKVPEQLRIIGYDGTEITKLSYPALSVVEQDCPAIAAACADRLVELLDGKSAERETIVPVIWKSRGTT